MTIVYAGLSLLVTILFLLILRPVAVEVGLLDVPGGRKRHLEHVPLIGGIAMAMGLGFGSSLANTPAYWNPVLLAIYLLIAVGTIDDRYDLPASVRLLAHGSAAMLVVFGAGLVVTSLGSPLFFDLPLGMVSTLFSILFVVTLISAFNVVDGLDGLAGGLAFITLGAGLLVAGDSPALVLLVLLSTVVGGFLVFNLPFPFNRPVRVFMGDAGSTSLGLAIAAVGFALTQGAEARMSPVTGLWLIALPVFDLFCAIIRRLRARRSVFTPDNHHLHHKLLEHGCSPRLTLFIMLGLAALFAGIGLIGHAANVADGWMLLGWFACGVFYYNLLARTEFWLRSMSLKSDKSKPA